MLRIDEVTEQDRLIDYRHSWRALVDRAPNADMFQTYEWVTSWLGCFWAERPIRFLFVWDGPELVALAPLLHDRDAKMSCRGSATLPVNSHARRFDFVCAANPAEVLEAVLLHLQDSGETLRLNLRQSREDSPIAQAIGEVVDRLRLGSMQLPSRTCPIVRIDSTWDDYLATRPSQVQRELKRKVRKIEREWKAQWVTATTPAECAAAMKDVWKIEQQSWKEEEGTSLSAEEDAVKLYEDFAASFARAGWLRMHLLYLNGTPVAHILGAEFHGEYFALKTSYDQEFRRASPGQALFFVALKDAFERRLKVFDFLGDESRWKQELANDGRRHINVCAHARFDAQCAMHTLVETQLKPMAKQMAPRLVALRHKVTPRLPMPVPEPVVAPTPVVAAQEVVEPEPLRKSA